MTRHFLKMAKFQHFAFGNLLLFSTAGLGKLDDEFHCLVVTPSGKIYSSFCTILAGPPFSLGLVSSIDAWRVTIRRTTSFLIARGP